MLFQLEKKGERYEARNVVSDMIKVFGPQPELSTALCRLYALDDYNEKTVEMCQEAIDKAPSVPENHMYLGLALKNRDQGEKAHKVLTGAAKRFPASEPVQWAMGELSASNKDFVGAYNYYKKACAADPRSARAWVGYGSSAFELQKYNEALVAFVKGCKADRTQTKEFRSAIGRLRVRKDATWQAKFEMAINECSE
jgi:tetratricopeptide (TPR) repeat protein